MAKPQITLKSDVAPNPLTYQQLDTNFTNLKDATITLTANANGTEVVADLNGNITLLAGSGISIAGDNTAKTVTITNTATGGGNGISFLQTSEVDFSGDSNLDTVILEPITASRNFFLRSDEGSIGLSAENGIVVLSAPDGFVEIDSLTLTLGNDDSENEVINITTNDATSLKLSNDGGSSTASIEIESGAEADVIVITDGKLDVTGNVKISQNLEVDGLVGSTFAAGITAPKFVGAATKIDVETLATGDTGNTPLLLAANISGEQTPLANTNLRYTPSTQSLATNITGNCGGSSASAATLDTARVISMTGDVSWSSVAFDGSQDVSGNSTLATVFGSPGDFTLANITVDAKGRITAAANGGVKTVDNTTSTTGFLLFSTSAVTTSDTFATCAGRLDFNASTGRLTTLQHSSALVDYKEVIHNIGTASGTLSIDAANGNVQTATLTGNITINGLANAAAGQSVTLILLQDSTGSRTLSSNMKFAGGINTLSTAANTIDVLHIFFDGTNNLASLIRGYI